MKKYHDREKIQRIIEENKIPTVFLSQKILLSIMEYRKGELIAGPGQNDDLFQIVYSGYVSIYAIQEDGDQYSIRNSDGLFLLGDMEFCEAAQTVFFAEAQTTVYSLAFSISQYREQLREDLGFMRFLAEMFAKKLAHAVKGQSSDVPLVQRIMNYMKYSCPENRLCGIEKSAFILHCSARQLQRILNRLEAEGEVTKCGKGTYQLTKHTV